MSLLYFDGAISVKAILENEKRTCDHLYVAAKKSKNLAYILHLAKQRGICIEWTTKDQLDQLMGHQKHGGLVLSSGPRQSDSIPKGWTCLLDGFEDPYQLGSALRSLYASGCAGVYLWPRDFGQSEAIIQKASAGAYEAMPIQTIDLEAFLALNLPLYCAHRHQAKPVKEVHFQANPCLVIGGRLRGIHKQVLAHSQQNLVIEYGRTFRNALDGPSATAILAFQLKEVLDENQFE